MPLRCRSSDHTVASAAAADFSVVVDAALVQVPGGGGGVLAGVFEQDVLGGVASSALCVYKMADVRRRFTDNIRRCFAGQQSYAGLQFGNRVCVALVSLQAALLHTLLLLLLLLLRSSSVALSILRIRSAPAADRRP